MLKSHPVTTPYSSYHVGYLSPAGKGQAWKARHLTTKQLIDELREIADEIELSEREALLEYSPEVRELAERVGLREALKIREKKRLIEERDFFARGGLKDTEGNIIHEPSDGS